MQLRCTEAMGAAQSVERAHTRMVDDTSGEDNAHGGAATMRALGFAQLLAALLRLLGSLLHVVIYPVDDLQAAERGRVAHWSFGFRVYSPGYWVWGPGMGAWDYSTYAALVYDEDGELFEYRLQIPYCLRHLHGCRR